MTSSVKFFKFPSFSELESAYNLVRGGQVPIDQVCKAITILPDTHFLALSDSIKKDADPDSMANRYGTYNFASSVSDQARVQVVSYVQNRLSHVKQNKKFLDGLYQKNVTVSSNELDRYDLICLQLNQLKAASDERCSKFLIEESYLYPRPLKSREKNEDRLAFFTLRAAQFCNNNCLNMDQLLSVIHKQQPEVVEWIEATLSTKEKNQASEEEHNQHLHFLLIEMAKLMAQQGLLKEQLGLIHYFPLTDENERIEIAKLCAKNKDSADDVASEIETFHIHDQQALIEIATLCAVNSKETLACYIHQFGIKSEKARIEIAYLCARDNVVTTAQHFKKFKIQSLQARVDLAIVCLKKPRIFVPAERTVVWYISEFEIKDPTICFELAKLSASSNPQATAANISNFGINDLKKRILLGKYCARQSAEDTLQYMSSLAPVTKGHQESLNERFHLFVHFFINAPHSILSPFDRTNLIGEKKQQLLFALSPLSQSPPLFDDLLELQCKTLQDFIGVHLNSDPRLLQLTEQLKTIQNTHILTQTSKWLASILFYFKVSLTDEQRNRLLKTGLIEALFKMRAPTLRAQLSTLLADFGRSEESFALFSRQSNPNQSNEKRLLDMILCSLQTSGVSRETVDNAKAIFAPLFKEHVESRSLLEALYRLEVSLFLTAEEKEKALLRLCEGAIKGKRENAREYQERIKPLKPLLKKRVFTFLIFFQFKEDRLLPKEGCLVTEAEKLFEEKLRIKADDAFIEKFRQSFSTERDSISLINYASSLYFQYEPAIIDDLRSYIMTVIDGSFATMRCKLENNPHLQMIHQYSPSLLDNWSKPLEPSTVQFLPGGEEPFNSKQWLMTKLQMDHHHAPNSIPQLDALISGQPINAPLSPLEEGIKDLIDAQSQKEQIAALEKIENTFSTLKHCDFMKDVIDQLKIFKNPASKTLIEATVVDTDGYFDLLLCGTEVLGSCQDVNNATGNNKGLLGYLLDGKNRLIANKEKYGQASKARIISRAKLSILWDGEKPALFLERPYFNGPESKQQCRAIEEKALEKANALGIPLTALKGSGYTESNKTWNKDLHALGSGVSYEYSDAAKKNNESGLHPNGQYFIPGETIAVLGENENPKLP